MNDDANRLTFEGVTFVTANQAVLMVMMASGYSGGGAHRRLVQAWRAGAVRGLVISQTQRWFALDDVQALIAQMTEREVYDNRMGRNST